MKRLARAMIAVLPLALSGCFLSPGAFTSTLDLRRDGAFTFAYKGEVIFESPEDVMTLGDDTADAAWSDDKATCDNEDAAEVIPGERTRTATVCSASEVARQRKDWETARKAKAEKRSGEAKQFGAIFGFTPGDDAANRKLAATYARYRGYRSVTYRGNGVFDVDYVARGMLTHDFVFPVLPQQDVLFPFVVVRRQADGSARVNAPSLIGGGLRGMAAKMKGLGSAMSARDMPASGRTRGTFTITTDGEVLTNNTEDGATGTPGRRTLKWDISPETQKVPETLIRMRP